MGAEREQTFEAIVMELHILHSSPISGPLLEICISQSLLHVPDLGKNGRAEYFISIAVICCFPWQRLILLFPEWFIL